SSLYSVGPWARARAMVPLPESRWTRLRVFFTTALSLGVMFGSVLLARRNLQASRADRKGAARLAGAYILLQLAAWIVGAHHQSDAPAEVDSFFRVAGTLLLQAGILWVLYLALEPFGRRFWPDGLLGWSRLLSGRLRVRRRAHADRSAPFALDAARRQTAGRADARRRSRSAGRIRPPVRDVDGSDLP